MTNKVAVQTVTAIRAEVVQIVGICGQGTHPLTELLEALERQEVRPEEAVEQAIVIRSAIPEHR